jgi:hypothetical protein
VYIPQNTRRSPIDWRPLAFSLAAALALLAALMASFGLRSGPDAPSGVIGYQVQGEWSWVSADTAVPAPGHAGAPAEALHVGLGAVTGAVPWEFPAPGGERIAYLDPGTAGYLFIADSSSITQIGRVTDKTSPELIIGDKGAAALAGGVPLIAAWSPDAALLAWGSLAGVPETLHVSTADGEVTRTFALEEGYVGEAVWSPDGRYLAISSYDEGRHGLYVLDTRDWSFAKLLDGCHIVWSPDSNWMALHRDPGDETGVWTVSPEDPRDRAQITSAVRAFPVAWHP